MRYEVQIDLKKLPLFKRNNIVDAVKRSGDYYQLENQVISMTIKTLKKITEVI